MRISDLMADLEKIREAEGDLPVALSRWNGQTSETEVESLDLEARRVEAYEIGKFSRDGLTEGRYVVFF